MKKFFLIPFLWLFFITGYATAGISYTIVLNDGTAYNVDAYWEEEGKVYFELYGGSIGIDKNRIDNIKERAVKTQRVKRVLSEEVGGNNEERRLSRNQSFDFNGFKWTLLNARKLQSIGRTSNLQYPKNGCFLIIEAKVKNISNEPRYYGEFTLLAKDKQYSSSTKVSVYGEYSMGYDIRDTTKFEPGVELRSFFGFDAINTNDYTLIFHSFGAGSSRKTIKLSPLLFN